MKTIASLLAVAALAFPLALQAAEHGHHQHDMAPQKLELNAGKKWPTDEPLRKGMDTIRKQVAAALPQAHAGKLTPSQFDQLGQEINQQIGYIVQNCKLDPKADAQLHVIIGEMAQSVDALEGKQSGKDRAHGLVKAAQAVNTYGRYFDHAGWQPVKLPH